MVACGSLYGDQDYQVRKLKAHEQQSSGRYKFLVAWAGADEFGKAVVV